MEIKINAKLEDRVLSSNLGDAYVCQRSKKFLSHVCWLRFTITPVRLGNFNAWFEVFLLENPNIIRFQTSLPIFSLPLL